MMRSRQKQRPDLYGQKWLSKKDSPARQAKKRDGNVCVDCGQVDRLLILDEAGQPHHIEYLHGAHIHPLDPDFSQVEPIENQRLRARCPRCHGRYDHYWRQREAEVAHQVTLHSILLHRFIMSRFTCVN